jgi:hypothetical protein
MCRAKARNLISRGHVDSIESGTEPLANFAASSIAWVRGFFVGAGDDSLQP